MKRKNASNNYENYSKFITEDTKFITIHTKKGYLYYYNILSGESMEELPIHYKNKMFCDVNLKLKSMDLKRKIHFELEKFKNRLVETQKLLENYERELNNI